MSKQIEISQLHATPDATYVNGVVEGYLVGIRPPNGKGPSKAKLQEGAGSIDVSLWGGDVLHWEGKRVRFSGKGMQIKEWKGVKSLSVGDKVLIEDAGSNRPLAGPEHMEGDPPPAPMPYVARNDARGGQTPPPAQTPRQEPRNRPESLPINLPHGATVGLSINNAREIWLAMQTRGESIPVWDERSRFEVETIAADFLDMACRLENKQPIPPANPF